MACPLFSSEAWKNLVRKIGVFEAFREFIKHGEVIPNADDYQESFKGINATLKIIDALANPKIQGFFKNQYLKGNKGKFYKELNTVVDVQQVELFKTWADNNPSIINIEHIMVGIMSEMAFTVEITNKLQDKEWYYYVEENTYDKFKGSDKWLVRSSKSDSIDSSFATKALAEKERDMMNESISHYTHYEDMTVPGGTNYTENEIRTPGIVPSIQGHAAFATPNGIGWFRSDEVDRKNKFTKEELDQRIKKALNTIDNPDNALAELMGRPTRRILEIQSDYFQKQRKSSEPDIHISYDIQKIIRDLEKSGDLEIKCD